MEKKKTFDVKSLLKISSNNKKLLGMLILVIIVLSIATGGSFAKIGQFQLIAYLFPEMGVLALGMMLAMVSGGIDLTVIAVADLAGILSCLLMKAIMPADASMPVQILDTACDTGLCPSDRGGLRIVYRNPDRKSWCSCHGGYSGRFGYYPWNCSRYYEWILH